MDEKEPPSPQLLDRLIEQFGGNYAFVLDLLEQYREDPRSVDPTWADCFQKLHLAPQQPEASQPPPSAAVPPPPVPAHDAAAEDVSLVSTASLVAAPQARPLARANTRALAVPVILPGDIAVPIRGGAVRIVENMEASLLVPTATSVRTIPVRTLEENRRLLNKQRDALRQGKVSFTHIITWAILRALDTFPRLNDAFADLEGQPHRVQRDAVRLGIAVDVQRKDGTRMLLVPNIKDAGKLTFGELLQAYDDLVLRARHGRMSPDDFMGTTVSLTNPGTLGTTLSAPRLMAGQGLIVATGALDYPAEYRSMAPRTLSLLGISKVMTLTATYDHRIIQGAESGLFLSRIEELLRGDDGFYERVFEDLKVPHRPVRWEIDVTPGLVGSGGGEEVVEKQAKVLQLIRTYRVLGHLVSDIDPLGARREPHPDLDPATYGLTIWDMDREFFTERLAGRDRASLREILDVLRDTYCGTVTAEYMYIADPERRRWLQEKMESSRNRASLTTEDRRRILEKLVEAESFERFLHSRYLGHKRFSLEGCEALIPLLDRFLTASAEHGVAEVVVGMPHRGRLSVLANIVGKPLAQIFSEFEGHEDPDSAHGSGDVKYHLGAAGTFTDPDGRQVAVTVAPNPSHLEAVNPVVEGMARARQDALGDTRRLRVIPVLLHGDAAFAGQGIVAETLNLAGLSGYTTGGTLHVVVDNQIGFTTLPRDARSSTYSTDVARMVQAPVLHVNADDPEAVVHVAALAFEYRQQFGRDIVIDLVGYRRWGHNEGDEPAYTQPLLYAKIKSHPSVAEIYGDRLVRSGATAPAQLSALWAGKREAMEHHAGGGGALAAVIRRAGAPPAAVDSAAMRGRLRTVLRALGSVPEGFSLHPKLLPHIRRRADLLEGKGEVDWATAEALAFGTLLLEGIPVRLSGQDSGRGTFSQRHAILYDVRTGAEHVALNEVAPSGTRFAVHDSLLSEAAVMGFELGYSVAEHRTLVLWEAQFGDFANAGQVMIDQFIVASETKWGQPSALVLMLPHGHEGQGPEHSSARLERFLTLGAEQNIRIAWPSTPAQLFHLLRRQARDPVEKPLVMLTPKSLLRNPLCVSPLQELADGAFAEVLDDATADPRRVRRVALVSGKLYFDLAKARTEAGATHVALVRLEQLYPFRGDGLASILAKYASAEVVYCQEEPKNMGAWRFMRDRFLEGDVPGFDGCSLRYIGRRASASPAPGSFRAHQADQDAIVRETLA